MPVNTAVREQKLFSIFHRLAIAAATSALLSLIGCNDLIGTCCCMDASNGNSIQARNTCTQKGGICSNINVCATQGPSSSPSPTPFSRAIPIRPNFMFSTLPLSGIDTEVEGHVLAGSRQSRSHSFKKTGDSAQCDAECANNGEFCLKVSLDNSSDLLPKVEKARVLMMDQVQKKIATKQFMQIFGINGPDPCAREDTSLSTTGIANKGKSCDLTSTINNSSGNFSFVVHLPPLVEGERSVESDRLVLLFNDAAEAPGLTIGDKGLNRDFGGTVERAVANHNEGIISTANGCLGISTGLSSSN